ncbi:MAG: hypothetical protein GU359_08125 [Desulfurococcales archaeon]|nr:hypothetical protein [Desulfurococcales archaeon]
MIKAKIDKKLELKFRELAMRRYGYSKGAISRAVEDAILKWISLVEKEQISFEGDPIEAIKGILSDVKFDSVELQHMIKDIWISRLPEKFT